SAGPVQLGGSAEAANAAAAIADLSASPMVGLSDPTEQHNPFSQTEPFARAAYDSLHGAVPNPAPAPAPPTPPPPPPQAYAPPPVAGYPPPQGYPPPASGYPAQYAPPQGYGVYALPPDGNTSGMGDSYPVPDEARGWTFAGFVPWGLFSFING